MLLVVIILTRSNRLFCSKLKNLSTEKAQNIAFAFFPTGLAPFYYQYEHTVTVNNFFSIVVFENIPRFKVSVNIRDFTDTPTTSRHEDFFLPN